MRNKFSLLTHKGRWLLATLTLIFTLGIGQMWGAATNFHDFVAAGDTIIDLQGTGSGPSAKITAVNNTDWAAISTSTKNNSSFYVMDPSTEAVATSKSNTYGTKLGSSAKSTYKVTGVSNVIFYVGTGSADRIAKLDVTENGKSKVSEAASVTLSTKANAYKMSYALDASKSYTLEAYASEDIFCYAVKFTVASKCTKPGTPTSLAAGSVTHNSASLSWTAGANNDGHKIYIEKKSDKTKVLDWTDATSPYAASGLDPETTYTFKVKAKGATGFCDLGDEASADFATEVDPSATTYTVTLMPAGGTCESYTGWTYDDVNNKYTKEVSEGTELSLPTFTKANRTFKTWRKAGPTDVTSPITVTADVTLTAVWNATVENVIYSWEGAKDGATEVGGTAATVSSSGTDNFINIEKGGYYCLQISGGTSYDKYVEITLSGEEKVKTGDKIKYWGFYYKDKSANARPKMRDGNSPNAQIFDDDTNLPNLYDGTGSPAVREFTVLADINTNKVQITRTQTGSNTWIPKIQIIRPTLVEEANLRTVTFNYNDGGATESTTVEVASGSKVAAPADPTYAHHRFHEWQLGGVAYDFSTAVTSNITLTADWTQLYTVTYAKGAEDATGDAPTQDELAAGEKFTVAANTFEYEGHDFSTWNDGSADYAPGVKYTMGSANVTLTAQWITATTKVTVTYKDGETTLGSEEITINTGNPVGYATYQTKNLATFDGWYNDPDLAEGHKIADISALTASANVNVYGKWNYQYATSVNIEQWILTNGAGKGATTKTSALINQLGTNHFASNLEWVNENLELDSLSTKDGRNEPYLGLKVKVGGKMLDFRVAEGQKVKIKFGAIKSTLPQVKINGVGNYEDMEITEKVWSYTAAGNDYISIKMADANAVVFKQIMIGTDPAIETVTLPLRVTYNANGGTCAEESAVWSSSALTLPDVTPAEPADYTFAGWYNGETRVGDAGDSYTPIEELTLLAHFAPVEYAVNYSGGEDATGTMTAGAAGWGTMVTPDANAFEKTGHVFSGWKITKTSDGSATGITFSEGKFEMPKYDVTLVAQWEDISKVAVIVETNVKYESLAEAIAAAETGYTVQLLQNIDVTAQVEVAGKAITLELAGYTINYTGAELASGVILVHNGASLTINDSSEPDAGGVISNAAWAALTVTKKNDDASNPAVLIVNGGNFVGWQYAITGNGNRHNTEITINGGTFSAANTSDDRNLGIYHPQNGTLTINGGTITGYASAIEMRAGTLVITGGTLNATATEFSCNPNGSGMTTVGAAIAISQHTTKKDIDVTISGGTFSGEKAINESNPQVNDPAPQVDLAVTGGDFTGEVSTVDVHEFISGGTFDAQVTNENCAPGWVPAPQDPVTGKYSVEPKDGVEIIGVVTTGGTNKTVSGLYQGDATVNLDDDKKIASGKYIYVTLASGYTFEETDVLVVDVYKKSDLPSAPALEITTGVGNIDGSVWKSIANADYELNLVTIPLKGIAANQTSIGLKRSEHQNTWVNGLKVYRPMMPELTAISFNGVAATKGTGNAYSVTLPEEGTNLASLTIVPTIIRNAAHATTPEAVVSNEGAWVEGDNTYRVMDKDGDYTDYTITITLQGEAPAPVITTQPADVAYCAGSEPTLTVVATGDELHYAWFKEAGETDEAVGSDKATYTVASAGTYYVMVTNHVDGKLDASVTSSNAVVTLNTPASITTQPTDMKKQIEGANITLSVVAANATGYQWYSCDNKDKENPSLIAGADEAEFEFAAAAGFYYCEVTGLCGAIESNVAEVTVKRSAGCQYINATSGSQANLTDGTIMYACGSDGKLSTGDNFAEASSNAKAIDADAVGSINKQYCVVKFPADVEEITLFGYNSSSRSVNNLCYGTAVGTDVKVNTAISSDDYVKTASNDGNERSMTIEFDEPFAKEKYLFIKYNSALEIYRICYTAALVEPKLPTLADQELCAGAAYETFDATITNEAACEGTVSYKWFSTADTENPVAETATFTPSAEGTYYVVVTHAATGHITRTVQSDELNVAHFDALSLVSYTEDVFQHMGTETTLSVVATGKNVAYVWYTCSNAAGDDAEAIDPAQTASSLTIASILEGVHYYKVVISHDCDETTLSHVFKVEGWDQLEQVDVTATTTWDMTNVSANAINLADMDPSQQNVRLLLANIDGVNNNASFNSQALMFEGQRIGSTANNVKYVSGQYVQFNVTVPGMVSVTFASNGNSQRTIQINGKVCSRTTNDGTYITYNVAVEPGSVEIEDVQGYVRISKIEFKAEDNYHRTVNPAYLGTLCWTNNAILGGATLYEFAGKNENNYLVFDEVAENRLEAGKPYIFMPENGNTEIKVYNTDNEDALTEDQDPVNNMYGTITGKTLVPGVDDNMYYFSSNHIWAVKDFVVNITIPAYYCYVNYVAVLNAEPAGPAAPGRRRVTMGVQGEQVATGLENLKASDKPMKLMINGQIFILRGEKMYDATGRLVK